MRRVALLIPILAACASRPEGPVATAPPARRIPLEVDTIRLDYGAGDGVVAAGQRVLTLATPAVEGRRRRSPAEIKIPGIVHVGHPFRVEIRVPRAPEGEVRRFRIRCARPGLRLLDGDLAMTVGSAPVVRRAVADSPGPAGFDLEEVAD